MTHRILTSSSRLGQQTLLVDSQGNGDYTSIQAALNQAALYASADSRWSVRVAPGTYDELITLKDYVDLAGLNPGRATRLRRSSGAVIGSPASCVLSNLWLESVDASILILSSAFTGTLELWNILIDQTPLDVAPFQVAGGALIVRHSYIMSGGAMSLSGGELQLHHSTIRNQAEDDGGQNMALYIQHGTLLAHHCLIENVSPAGYGVYIDGTITSLKAYDTIFRKSTAAYAIHASLSTAFTLARCAGNGALHANLTGYHDYVSDSSL